MKCPECGEKTYILQSWKSRVERKFECVKRKRRCSNRDCRYKFITYELEEVNLKIYKGK